MPRIDIVYVETIDPMQVLMGKLLVYKEPTADEVASLEVTFARAEVARCLLLPTVDIVRTTINHLTDLDLTDRQIVGFPIAAEFPSWSCQSLYFIIHLSPTLREHGEKVREALSRAVILSLVGLRPGLVATAGIKEIDVEIAFDDIIGNTVSYPSGEVVGSW